MAAAMDRGIVHDALLGSRMTSCDTLLSFNEMQADEQRLWEQLRLL